MSAKSIDPHALRQASNYLNTEFAGMPLEHIRLAVMERLRHERTLVRCPALPRAEARADRPGRAAEEVVALRRRRVLAAR